MACQHVPDTVVAAGMEGLPPATPPVKLTCLPVAVGVGIARNVLVATRDGYFKRFQGVRLCSGKRSQTGKGLRNIFFDVPSIHWRKPIPAARQRSPQSALADLLKPRPSGSQKPGKHPLRGRSGSKLPQRQPQMRPSENGAAPGAGS